VLKRLTTALFHCALRIFVVQWLPSNARLFHIKWFCPVIHRLYNKMQLALDTVPFIVSVSSQIGARWWRNIVVSMACTHGFPFRSPVPDSLFGPFSAPYTFFQDCANTFYNIDSTSAIIKKTAITGQ
jgi:hypothetical protein